MIDRDTEIVSSIRSALKTRLGADRFELWLGSATRIAARSNGVCITADSSFRVDCLRKSLLVEIKAVTREWFGPTAAVEFEVDPALGESTSSAAGSRLRFFPVCCLRLMLALRQAARFEGGAGED